MQADFQEFPKMARLSREIIITEKIDGTNAQIFITQGEAYADDPMVIARMPQDSGPPLVMYAGSRSRWITPQTDNHGFASWVNEHAEQLFELGEGRHFGEWWGLGIQRTYSQPFKRFSLFNVTRWGDSRPGCCGVVPELYRGEFGQSPIMSALKSLEKNGSVAAPGFMKPEGIVIYHVAAGIGFKKTIEKDDVPKSLA